MHKAGFKKKNISDIHTTKYSGGHDIFFFLKMIKNAVKKKKMLPGKELAD